MKELSKRELLFYLAERGAQRMRAPDAVKIWLFCHILRAQHDVDLETKRALEKLQEIHDAAERRLTKNKTEVNT